MGTQIENEYVKFWIEEGVIYNTYKSHVTEITLPMAKQIVADRVKLSGDGLWPGIIDPSKTVKMDSAARKYMASDEATGGLSAVAILVDNFITRMTGNLYLKIGRPRIPIQLFTSRTKALDWLENYKH